MELIKWSDKFATGISGIDSEHEELINSINSFYIKQSQDSDKYELGNILNNIYGSIHAHFMLEERLMQKHGYDEYEEHKNDHANLLDDIREITIEFEKTSELDEHKLKIKLNNWFMNHFKTHDSRLHKLEQSIQEHAISDSMIITSLKKLKAKIFNK